MTFKNILVPLDGSALSVRVFHTALDIAKSQNSKIRLLCCINKNDMGAWYIDKRINRDIMNNAKKLATKYLLPLEERAKKENVKTSTDVIEANSAIKQILSFAKSSQIDLIVMGSHGRTRLDRLLLGSVSNGVLQRASCPVLIVK
jgi:nucleotide-binding universal stress UspA family protein